MSASSTPANTQSEEGSPEYVAFLLARIIEEAERIPATIGTTRTSSERLGRC
jgi:hypothetical protein